MPAKTGSRTRLIRAAVKLTFRSGFGPTSLADFAKEAKISLGNIYYYFKTKEQIGEALVQYRLAHSHAVQQELDKAGSPRERHGGFIQMTFGKREAQARGGCAIRTF